MGRRSLQHESLRILLRESPETAVALCEHVLGHELPGHDACTPGDADFSQLKPAEADADQVLVLRAAGEPVMAIIVEVQRAIKAQKHQSWPLYAAALHHRLAKPPHFCPVAVLVVATTDTVARWARKPIASFQPGLGFAPWVVGPRQIPRVEALQTAREQTGLALLSAMTHGTRDGGERVVEVALQASSELDEERARVYTDLLLAALGRLADHILEAIMQRGEYTYQSDFAKKYYGQGKSEGKSEGKAEGKAEAILTVLRSRSFDVSDELEARILAVRDIDLLEVLLQRAVTTHDVAALDELIDEHEA